MNNELFESDPRSFALELVESGMVSADHLLLCALKYMSHDDCRDMLDANELSPRFDEVDEEPDMVVDGTQYRYIIDLDERGEFAATLYIIGLDGEDYEVFRIASAEQAASLVQAGFIEDVRDCEEVADYFIGLNRDPASTRVTCGSCARSWNEVNDPAPAAQCHWCNGRGYSTAPMDYGDHYLTASDEVVLTEDD